MPVLYLGLKGAIVYAMAHYKFKYLNFEVYDFLNFDFSPNTCMSVLYSKAFLKGPLKKTPKGFFKTNTHLVQFKSIAECSRGAFCSTFELH